jgi:hypothetical protein
MVRCGFSATGRRPRGESGQHGPCHYTRQSPCDAVQKSKRGRLLTWRRTTTYLVYLSLAWMAQLFAERLSSYAGSHRKAAKASTPNPMPARMRAMATTRPKIEICWAM